MIQESCWLLVAIEFFFSIDICTKTRTDLKKDSEQGNGSFSSNRYPVLSYISSLPTEGCLIMDEETHW